MLAKNNNNNPHVIISLDIVLDDPRAKPPQYATDGSGAFDIYSIEDHLIAEACPKVIRTGLKVAVPEGKVLLLFSRSGHGFNSDVRLSNCVGVIDSDYRGELMIKLTKDTKGALVIREGDRIAQGMVFDNPKVNFNVVTSLTQTERANGGFGSTGS